MMEGFYSVISVTGLNRPNTGKDVDDDDFELRSNSRCVEQRVKHPLMLSDFTQN
jgi:hypothetical protein